jgi:hypothetical protein
MADNNKNELENNNKESETLRPLSIGKSEKKIIHASHYS